MKKIKVSVKHGVVWSVGKRVIIRTSEGNMLGTVKEADSQKIQVTFDNGTNFQISLLSPSILGEGLQRKRRSVIPDDELFAWKRELCADCIGRI